MKSRKVLLGLIVGLSVCLAGTATAQKANFHSNKLVEIGPDNIGGRVTSIIVSNVSPNGGVNATLYAGTATGGLYTRSNAEQDIWNYIPCYLDGKELTLPISNMLQVDDSTILIATGESYYPKGSNLTKMAAIGRGLFLFNMKNNSFSRLNRIDPGFDLDANFASVSSMAMMRAENVTYVFIATPKGLFRWNIRQASDWNTYPQVVFEGNIRSVVVSKQHNRAFFSCGGGLYKISDVINASAPVNITGSCEGFGQGTAYIDLALAPSDESYLYAMASDNNGLMKGLYLTRNTNSWLLLSSSTVTPFNSVATAKTCGAISVDPIHPETVYIAGANVWLGQGFVPDSPYQWTVLTSNEYQLNAGDYMSYVYSNRMFVHSGVHQITQLVLWDEENMRYISENYFATDGGVYADLNNGRYSNYSRGLNNVQINGLAVAPDGSIISGANSNANPFIEARVAHNGGVNDSTWYDATRGNMNHMANIIWKGDGGKVAASRFMQYLPFVRRTLFVSSSNGSIGRAYADYSDYTNTQTWTSDQAFLSDQIEGGPAIGQIYLWETDHNMSNDSMTFTIDTLSYILRNGVRHNLSLNFRIQAGDSIMIMSPAHASYPFYHVFDHSFIVRDELRQTAHVPYASRMLAVTVENGLPDNSNVSYCWFPTDFRRVFDNSNETRFWSHIYGINGYFKPHMAVRYTAMSKNGDCAFVVVENDTLKQSFIARVRGLRSVDYNQPVPAIRDALNYLISTRVTKTDTILVSDSNYFFGRRISSITVDPREGTDCIILTFDGFNNNAPNVVRIENASSDNYRIVNMPLPNSLPAYSAMIECTKGEVYVGTEDGVFMSPSLSNPSWTEYGDFRGVPVTAMEQVTYDYPMVKHIGHDGVSEVLYVYPRTKWSKAMYFGTYGRGIFMDSSYVKDHRNEIVSEDIYLDIPTVASIGDNAVRFYPNPAVDNATMELTIGKAGKTTVYIYDITGKVVYTENLGTLAEGVHTHTINCQTLPHGMYLVNVVVGSQKATSKLIVR